MNVIRITFMSFGNMFLLEIRFHIHCSVTHKNEVHFSEYSLVSGLKARNYFSTDEKT